MSCCKISSTCTHSLEDDPHAPILLSYVNATDHFVRAMFEDIRVSCVARTPPNLKAAISLPNRVAMRSCQAKELSGVAKLWPSTENQNMGIQKEVTIHQNQNCLQWGRPNLVDPAERPKIRLLSRDLGTFWQFSLETAKDRVHQIFFSPNPIY